MYTPYMLSQLAWFSQALVLSTYAMPTSNEEAESKKNDANGRKHDQHGFYDIRANRHVQ